ncbi:MAG: hypothetical protein DHS20C16_36290 [Phycisphaerae bacterium]|nr:MAG: hypothetical protein DHS20C16_36290 [Phycisphaerae bacterium]
MGIVTAVLSMMLAAGVGYLSHFNLNDVYSFNYRPVEWAWCHIARLLSVLIVVASASTVASSVSASTRLRYWCPRLLSAAILGTVALFLLGFAWVNEAEYTGGDWAGLTSIIATIVGNVAPGVMALLCSLQLLAHIKIHRQSLK